MHDRARLDLERRSKMSTLTDYLAANKELRMAVMREIVCRPDIHSKDISVRAHGPVVTLLGFVPTFAEKANAERAAKSVPGVLSIANDIEVRPSTRTDPEIAADIQHALQSNVMVPQAKITAAVHEGFVTLEGTVDWNYEKGVAVEAAESVLGVRGVINLLAVKLRVSPASVKEATEAALRRNEELDSNARCETSEKSVGTIMSSNVTATA
jgi:osmotically-inducible protein OsmY